MNTNARVRLVKTAGVTLAAAAALGGFATAPASADAAHEPTEIVVKATADRTAPDTTSRAEHMYIVIDDNM